MNITQVSSNTRNSSSFMANLHPPTKGALYELIERNQKIKSTVGWAGIRAEEQLEKGLDIFLTDVPKGEILPESVKNANAKISYSDNRVSSYFFFDLGLKSSELYRRFCAILGMSSRP